jgi:hypothetical protein
MKRYDEFKFLHYELREKSLPFSEEKPTTGNVSSRVL